MAKLRFKKEFEDAVISIPSRRLQISKFNIDQPEVQEALMRFPKYAHNFELVTDEEGNTSVQPGTMLQGGGEGVDLLSTEEVAPKSESSKTHKKSAGKGKK